MDIEIVAERFNRPVGLLKAPYEPLSAMIPMDDYDLLMQCSSQCRRLASGLLDPATIETLGALIIELEDRAALAAKVPRASSDGQAPRAYVISRVDQGWMVSRGADRVAVRSTLPAAHAQALKFAALDQAEGQDQP
jgi:hypothetical protein